MQGDLLHKDNEDKDHQKELEITVRTCFSKTAKYRLSKYCQIQACYL